MSNVKTAENKLGPVSLQPGVTGFNVATLFYSNFVYVPLVAFLNFIQPYLLNNMMQIPAGQQGSITGALGLSQEITGFFLMSVAGAMSDRIGRRFLCVVGFAIMGLGLIVYPLATSIPQLVLFRIFFSVGAAVASIMTISALHDYAHEKSRGKLIGFNSIFTGLGIISLSLTIMRLPKIFTDMGYSTIEAGQFTFWAAAIIAFITASIIGFGYKAGTAVTQQQQESVLKRTREGFALAKRNPRIALVLAAAFASRGDMIIVGTYFSLWTLRAGVDQGIAAPEAMATYGILISVLTVATLTYSPALGFILDRVNRVAAVAVCFAIAAATYLFFSAMTDPFNLYLMVPAAFLLGVGEMSAVLSVNALLGQEAPPHIRGTIVGVFGLVGTVGIMVGTGIGGVIFDTIGYTAPFALMGIFNLIVAIAAYFVWLKARGPAPGEIGDAPAAASH